MPLIRTYLKLHSKPFRDRMKRRRNNALVRIIHIERSSGSFEKLTFYFAKFIKPPDRRLIKERMIGNSVNCSILQPPKNWKSNKPDMDEVKRVDRMPNLFKLR